MPAQSISSARQEESKWALARVTAFSRLRALAWSGNVLYASRGYNLQSAKISGEQIEWNSVGRYRPAQWRKFTSIPRLTFRLFRDGFHALAIHPSGHLFAAVPGAIIRLAPGETDFTISHVISRGTRPLHIAAAPNGDIFWGEYFDNREREEVHIYGSTDCGATWNVAYTFSKNTIRHVHNIVYDQWQNCFWVLTGDNGTECRVLRFSCNFREVEVVLQGNQQARAVALVPTPNGVYFPSDTPFELNHIYRLDRGGELTELAGLSSSSVYGCGMGSAFFFSTMVEPSAANLENRACLYGSLDGSHWDRLLQWEKDRWPMGLFQYGNVILPDGENTSGLLALSTVAVQQGDLETSFWQIVR